MGSVKIQCIPRINTSDLVICAAYVDRGGVVNILFKVRGVASLYESLSVGC